MAFRVSIAHGVWIWLSTLRSGGCPTAPRKMRPQLLLVYRTGLVSRTGFPMKGFQHMAFLLSCSFCGKTVVAPSLLLGWV